MSGETAVFRNLREPAVHQAGRGSGGARAVVAQHDFEPVFCEGAEAAVAAVRDAIAADDPFAVAFLDMRMPPGPDGVWAAARIRELDPAIEIVLCTAYSDVDPAEMGGIVPPEEKLSYLQKPFHPHEIRQMTISLASKWRAEHRIVKLAYFDALTGLAESRAVPQPPGERARGGASSTSALLAVLYLDLDNFKRVNDTLGPCGRRRAVVPGRARACGIRCARTRAPRRMIIRPRARITSRGLGGDEFIVILPGIRSSGGCRRGRGAADRRAAAAHASRAAHPGDHAERRHRAISRRTARTSTRCSATRTSPCISRSARVRACTRSSTPR